MKRALRRFLRIVLVLIILLLFLVAGGLIALQSPSVKNKISNWAIESLNSEFGTQLSVDSVDINWFGDIFLNGVKVKDHHDYKFIDIERIQASLDLFKLIQNQDIINLKRIILHNPKVEVITYIDEDTDNFILFTEKFDDGKPGDPNSKFTLKGTIIAKNGTLSIVNRNLIEEEQLWLDANQVYLKVSDFNYFRNAISASLDELKFEAKKNDEEYIINHFGMRFCYDSHQMRFDEIDLQTGDSKILGNLIFDYQNIKDFADFNERIIWNLDLESGSVLNYKDLRYFLLDWSGNQSLKLNAKVKGVLNDWQISNLKVDGTNLNLQANKLGLKDILDSQAYQINAQGVVAQSSVRAIQSFLPKSYEPEFLNQVVALGNFNFRGKTQINPISINTEGNLNSDLGSAKVDLFLDNYSEDYIVYRGNISTNSFNVRPLAELDFPLNINADLDFDGIGTNPKKIKVASQGYIRNLRVMDYSFNNVRLDGTLDAMVFEGNFDMQDARYPLDFDGVVDFSTDTFKANFVSNLRGLPLYSLGIKETEDTRIYGQAQSNFSFKSLDEFLGTINFPMLELVGNSFNESLENVNLESLITETDGKILQLNIPGRINLRLLGDYKISQLGSTVENALSLYLPEYQYVEAANPANFRFYAYVDDNPFEYLFPDVQLANKTLINGTYNELNQDLELEINSSRVSVFDNIIYGIDGKLNAKINTKPSFNIVSDSVNISNLIFRDFEAQGESLDSILNLNTKFAVGKKKLLKFDLNVDHSKAGDGSLVFLLSPSSMFLNDTNWKINKNKDSLGHRIVINPENDEITIDSIDLVSGMQRLSLNGKYLNAEDYKIAAKLTDVQLENVIPNDFIPEGFSIDGLVNGKVDITRDAQGLSPTANVEIVDLTANDYLYGTFQAEAAYDTDMDVYNIIGNLEKGNYQTISISGLIDNSKNEPLLDLAASIDKFEMNFLEGFLSGVISNVSGHSSGYFNIKGKFDSPDVTGYLDLDNFGFLTDYTKVAYKFPGKPRIPINKFGGLQGIMNLEDIQVVDSKYETKGDLVGVMLFEDLGTWYMNLILDTNRLLFLDTKISDNELFFGRVFGQGSVLISGPTDDVNFDIKAKSLTGSEFTINTGSSFVETDNSLVRFISDSTQNESGFNRVDSPLGLTMNMQIQADPSTKVNLIFDEASDHGVRAQGSTDNLTVNIEKSGSINMQGTYSLSSGTYQLRQGLALNKNFEIEPGSRISWSGDPYNADMNIRATFDRTVSNLGEYLGIGFSQTYLVRLIVGIQESLSSPEISFDVDVPNAGTDIDAQLTAQFNNNPDEKLSQFSAVLFLGKFLNPNERQDIAGGAATAVAAEVALRQVSNILTSIARQFQIDFEYVQGDDLNSTGDVLRTRLGLKLDPRWTVRGAFGVPLENGNAAAQTVFTGEGSLEYDISKNNNGSTVLRIFTEPTTFGVENFNSSFAFNQSYGGGIVFRKSFDSFRELFKKKVKDEGKNDSIQNIVPQPDSVALDTLNVAQKKKVKAEKRSGGLIRF